MANPTTEGNSFLDPKGSCKLLKAIPLCAIAEDTETTCVVSQNRSSRAQREITSFAGDQASNEDQLKLLAGLLAALVAKTKGAADAGLWDKEEFFAIGSEFGIGLGGGGYDGCRVPIRRSSKRH